MDAIDPALRIRSVELAVGDLPRSVEFYERVLGLPVLERDEQQAQLGTDGRAPALVLRQLAAPTPLPVGATGLFHVAWLHPSRGALADSVRRVARARWPLEGASDHGVSEALYLSDPDGLGIEIYADRPRESWPRPPAGEGVAMVTLPLDLEDLLGAVGRPRERARPRRHRRRTRAPEGLGRAARERLLPRRPRLRRAGADAVRRLPGRRRLPPSHRPQLVAERRERARPRTPRPPYAGSSSS